jgi:hypothetical protein
LLDHYNDGEKEIVVLKPDANPVVETVLLTAGCQQSLPSGAIQLLDVLSNMGITGTTRGDVVSVVEKKYLNSINPSWMKDTATAIVTHVVYDVDRSPKLYWVYPPSLGTNYLELMVGKLPTAITSLAQNMNLGEEFISSLVHYVVYKSLLKDTDVPNYAAQAIAYYQAFLSGLRIKDMVEKAITPKRTREAN